MSLISLDHINLLALNVGFARHNADWNWQQVLSPFSRIYLVTEGEAWIILPSGRFRLTPGHLYLIPANIMHGYECNGPFSHYYLHVYEERMYETSLFDKYNFPVEVVAHTEDLLLMKRLCQLLPDLALPGSNPELYNNRNMLMQNMHELKRHDMSNRMEIRGINLILLSRFMEEAELRQLMDDSRVMKVMDYINSHIYQDIKLSELSDIACVSKGYIIGIFRRKVGLSPQQYINKVKIERAQLMLLTTDAQVKNIAYELGFNDHSYFIRLFKKITGFTPQHYREVNGL